MRDFKGAILAKLEEYGKPGLIAEVKKASPSRGVIQPDFDPVKIAAGYEAGGAACLSVLTDRKYFQGSFENLTAIRSAGNTCPLLCKEFIVDAYQIMKVCCRSRSPVLGLLLHCNALSSMLLPLLHTCIRLGGCGAAANGA